MKQKYDRDNLVAAPKTLALSKLITNLYKTFYPFQINSMKCKRILFVLNMHILNVVPTYLKIYKYC